MAKHADKSDQPNPNRPADYKPQHSTDLPQRKTGTGGKPRPNTGVQNPFGNS